MVKAKKSVVTLLIGILVLFCLMIMLDLPYEPRFIKTQFNYLFVAVVYFLLAILIMYRISLIEDSYIKKPFFFLGLIVIAFPCLFVVSVALESFTRVKNDNGEDSHFKLTKETIGGETVIRIYKKPDVSLALHYGFEISGKQRNYAPTPAYIFVTRTERDISEHLKIISSQKEL